MAKNEFWDKELSTFENIACAWPLIFIAFGGAIGGGLGACAWMINKKIMRSDYIGLVKYPAIIIVGFLSFAVYLAIVVGLTIAFPDVFAR